MGVVERSDTDHVASDAWLGCSVEPERAFVSDRRDHHDTTAYEAVRGLGDGLLRPPGKRPDAHVDNVCSAFVGTLERFEEHVGRGGALAPEHSVSMERDVRRYAFHLAIRADDAAHVRAMAADSRRDPRRGRAPTEDYQ